MGAARGGSAPALMTTLLYPHYTLDPASASAEPNLLASGTLALIPVDMTVTQMTRIVMTQVSLSQDFGIRCWLSRYPLGESVIAPPPGMMALSRMTPRPLIVYTAEQTPPSNTVLAQVPPGLYYLNVLNLTNCPVIFLFSYTDLA